MKILFERLTMKKFVSFVLALAPVLGVAELSLADQVKSPWRLPLEISDATATVSFEVDSTWHLVKGTTSLIRGRVWLADPVDFLSLRANVILPVDQFATDWESRDEKMKKVMHSIEHPEVTFQLHGVTDETTRCPVEDRECVYTGSGSLTISGHTENVKFPVRVRPNTDAYEVNIELDLRWGDFGVEDPSILLATLDPVVRVLARLTVPKNTPS
jgi:polyisoprenoid-binding protein YceI